jgi:hypothetical protein
MGAAVWHAVVMGVGRNVNVHFKSRYLAGNF